MEADWSVELAAEDPVIRVPWQAEKIPGELRGSSARVARFVDLRENPQAMDEIEEARDRPVLRFVLAKLNGEGSKLWTAKCDAWEDAPGNGGDEVDGRMDNRIDPWEMDAAREDAIFSAGCYIDLLFREEKVGGSFAAQERWIRRLSERVRGIQLRCARTDFVLRRAEVRGVPGFGVTWFVESCGASAELARLRRAEALAWALPILMEERLGVDPSGERYNGR